MDAVLCPRIVIRIAAFHGLHHGLGPVPKKKTHPKWILVMEKQSQRVMTESETPNCGGEAACCVSPSWIPTITLYGQELDDQTPVSPARYRVVYLH
ncbi:hypothetical protein Cob_v000211 [Colletotrichum orbiculare MAFF 240422]|uniref:Uncharacterized protein n=1 Tax=Colletotrichum orbiculare (strain 104-T / ATCC 96160 / CBS 514.97 / LARS 414 / MAFF 240422) TaxID=1213857 RepID=A0A484G9P1_COLOR|nr:hypothetical protein Cob_v000211 [Colletotrichum orbiculare MAFF 240422]